MAPRLLAAAASASLLVGGALLASFASPEDGAPDGTRPAATAIDTDLEIQMLGIQEQTKLLRRSVRKAETMGDALGQLQTLQGHIHEAKALTPAMAEGMAEEDQAAFVAAYRGMMVDMLAKTCELEHAVLEADVDQARKLHKELADMEGPGHERFTEDG